MSRRPIWVSLAALGASVAVAASLSAPVFAQETPPAAGPVTEYPNYGGEVDCKAKTFNGAAYTGQVKRISAPDAQTVVFELCNPDPAFLSKIAFISFAINDTDYLLNNVENGAIIEAPNGTGPYRLGEWRRGDQIIFEAFDGYWGEPAKAATAVLRWSSEPGQKFVELQSGSVDGIDNVQPDDIEAIEGNPDLELIPREGFNVFYLGMNRGSASNPNTPWDNVKVRQAIGLGIDRQAIIDQFYPAGSEVATHFAPCSMEFACGGDPWPEMDLEAARALLAEGLTEAGFSQVDGVWKNPDGDDWVVNVHYRVVDRAYLPLPDQVALAVVDQLQNNLGIIAKPDEVESTTYIDIANFGLLHGIHLLGWNGDFPDPSNFHSYHFGPGATAQFGDIYTEIAGPLAEGDSTADPAERAAAYEQANTAIRELVPMVPVAHAGSATAWRAGLEGAHSSPLGNEALFAVAGGDDGQLVFMQGGEPGGLYCADESDGESLRVCEQIMQGLYGYEVGGFGFEPSLATGCESNEDLSTWTCTLRSGVTFHDGATLDAGDVVLSYAVQWDRSHPLHVGRTGIFSYWGGTWGGYLPAPAP